MPLPKLVLVVLAALLALCAAVYGLTVAFEQEREAREVAAGDVQRVVVRTDSGRVSVRAGQTGGPLVIRRRARWLFGEPRLRRRTGAGELVLEASCEGAIGPCATDLDVVVPDGVDVTAESESGDVRAERLGGRVDLRTGRGDVHAAAVRPVSLRASATAGDLQLAFRNAPLQVVARTDAGDIEIDVPPNDEYRLDALYERGDLRVDGVFRNDLASRRIVAETAAGDVRLLGR